MFKTSQTNSKSYLNQRVKSSQIQLCQPNIKPCCFLSLYMHIILRPLWQARWETADADARNITVYTALTSFCPGAIVVWENPKATACLWRAGRGRVHQGRLCSGFSCFIFLPVAEPSFVYPLMCPSKPCELDRLWWISQGWHLPVWLLLILSNNVVIVRV